MFLFKAISTLGGAISLKCEMQSQSVMAGLKNPLFCENYKSNFWPTGANVHMKGIIPLYCIKHILKWFWDCIHFMYTCSTQAAKFVCSTGPFYDWTIEQLLQPAIPCLILILWFLFSWMYFRSFALNSHEYLSCIIRNLLKRKWGPIYLSVFSHEVTHRGTTRKSEE